MQSQIKRLVTSLRYKSYIGRTGFNELLSLKFLKIFVDCENTYCHVCADASVRTSASFYNDYSFTRYLEKFSNNRGKFIVIDRAKSIWRGYDYYRLACFRYQGRFREILKSSSKLIPTKSETTISCNNLLQYNS